MEKGYEDNWSKVVEKLRRESQRHREAAKNPPEIVIVRVDINIDGCQIATTTAQSPQMIPITARIAALELPCEV